MRGSDRRMARNVAVACLVVGGFWISWQLIDLLLLIFFAILVAITLHALAQPVAHVTRMPPHVALIVTAITVAVSFGLVFYLFGSLIQAQITELVERLPDAWASLRDRFELQQIEKSVMEQAKNNVPTGEALLTAVRGLTSNVANLLVGIFLVVAGGLYMAIQPHLYLNGLVALFPEENQEAARARFEAAGVALRLFLKAQLLAMVVVGLATGIGLWIIGVPSAFALGLFAGLAEFVPMVGPVASAIPALLLAATVGFETTMWTLLLVVVVQQMEGNVLTPLLQQQIVALPAAVALFAVVAFATLFGMMGVVLATPLTVLIFALVRDPTPAAR